ncbi:MAG: hypothetical protein H0T94_06175 [Acidimicrobiia bacterium]|nr:hypothetical protein [Acidimicrobiia bacterium]
MRATAVDVLGGLFEEEYSLNDGGLEVGSYEGLDPETGRVMGRPTIGLWTRDSLALLAESESHGQDWMAEKLQILSPGVDNESVVVAASETASLSVEGDVLFVTVADLFTMDIQPIEGWVAPDADGLAVPAGQLYFVTSTDDEASLILVTSTAVCEIDTFFAVDHGAAEALVSRLVTLERTDGRTK